MASVCEARVAAARVVRAWVCEARATRAVRRRREGDGGGEGGKRGDEGEGGESGGVGDERRRTRAALQYRTALAADTNSTTRRCSERLTDAWCDASERCLLPSTASSPCTKHQKSTLVARSLSAANPRQFCEEL